VNRARELQYLLLVQHPHIAWKNTNNRILLSLEYQQGQKGSVTILPFCFVDGFIKIKRNVIDAVTIENREH
jgi:hypothetical protein